MGDKVNFQKDVFHRVLRLHALRSTADNFEMLQLAIDDSIIFELVYRQIMEQLARDGEADCVRNDNNEIECVCLSSLLFWLSTKRSEILIELNSVIEAHGGIEIASFLIEDKCHDNARELFA